MFIYIREREREREGEREREMGDRHRGRDTENPRQTPGSELSTQSLTRGSNS